MGKSEDRYFKRKDKRDREKQDKMKAEGKEKFGSKQRDTRKVRKLKDGGIAFGNKAKIGRTGLIAMPTIMGLIIFVALGVNGAYDDYLPKIEDRGFMAMSFEECEAVDFAHDICKLDYKFCRDYADGESICQFAPQNPFVNVDPNERKWTDEEQDFLPPGGFALIQYAEARGESEPSCYSTACKKAMAESGVTTTSSSDDDSDEEIVCYSSACKVAMADRLKKEADGDDDKIVNEGVNPIGFNTIGISMSNSCAASISVGGDCMSYRELAELYDNTNGVISGQFVDNETNGDIRRASPMMDNHWLYYRYAGMGTLIAVDPDAKWYNNYMDVRIIIEPSSGFTYYDAGSLHVDTTNPNYALAREGVVIIEDEEEEDESEPNEPECYTSACRTMMAKLATENAIKEAEEKRLAEEEEAELEAEEDATAGKLTLYHDIYIEGCSFARISSDPYLVTEVINHFLNRCETEWTMDDHTEYVPVRSIPVDPMQHHQYKYNAWLNQKIMECKGLC